LGVGSVAIDFAASVVAAIVASAEDGNSVAPAGVSAAGGSGGIAFAAPGSAAIGGVTGAAGAAARADTAAWF
jgi:hypothetical protein